MSTATVPARAVSGRTAIVTGGSRGLGRALVEGLVDAGWTVVTDGRDAGRLAEVVGQLGPAAIAVPGDVTGPAHRRELVAAARGPIHLVVNNAGALGPSPLPAVADVDLDAFADVLAANVVAPLGVIQAALPHLAAGATVVDITSDASVEPYEGWGAYGASKAALDHLGAVLAVERPDLRILSIDPGDLRTDMHQAAFPGEDISDRPEPSSAVPGILALVDGDRPSGRYRVADLAPEGAAS